MPPPIVALVGPVPPWRSGIADQTLRLARAMAHLGVAPRVFTFRRMYPRFLYPGKGTGDFLEGEEGPALATLDGLNPFSFYSTSRKILISGPSLVVIPWWTAYFAPHVLLLLSGLSRGSSSSSSRPTTLLLCHNVFDHEPHLFTDALTRAVLRRADRFVAQSARNAGEILRVRPGARVEIVPHPSEPRAVIPDRAAARARLGVPVDAPVFLFSGLLRPYKGWDVLLDAFPAVRKEFPAALLVLAGEPWGEARDLATRAPAGVRLELRYQPEQERAEWFAACDAVVCPYRNATGSGIAADALAFSRPVIGTSVDGLSGIVEDGTSGLLVPPGDAAALASAMVRFVREGLGPRLSAGAAHRRAVFTPEEHARRVLAAGGIDV
ncbi:MAG: glycosyltransferase family 4 protein [Acidobacteriota bacterium]|nr:glycosyltransferase family 4 protein [Acidobacteriota bacterium]